MDIEGPASKEVANDGLPKIHSPCIWIYAVRDPQRVRYHEGLTVYEENPHKIRTSIPDLTDRFK